MWIILTVRVLTHHVGLVYKKSVPDAPLLKYLLNHS